MIVLGDSAVGKVVEVESFIRAKSNGAPLSSPLLYSVLRHMKRRHRGSWACNTGIMGRMEATDSAVLVRSVDQVGSFSFVIPISIKEKKEAALIYKGCRSISAGDACVATCR